MIKRNLFDVGISHEAVPDATHNDSSTDKPSILIVADDCSIKGTELRKKFVVKELSAKLLADQHSDGLSEMNIIPEPPLPRELIASRPPVPTEALVELNGFHYKVTPTEKDKILLQLKGPVADTKNKISLKLKKGMKVALNTSEYKIVSVKYGKIKLKFLRRVDSTVGC